MVLDRDFREFIALLNEHEVRYLVVGGHAVTFHGYPRYTKDLDVWVDVDESNAAKLMSALETFGFGSVGLQVSDFLGTDQLIQLGYPPQRIDILTGCKGVEFDHSFESKYVVEIEGLPINIIGLENLKTNKAAVGRPQDLADIANLQP